MIKQINKHKKKINYEIKDKVFLFSRNIITDRSFKRFKDKMLNSFLMTERVETFYQLVLSKFIKIRCLSFSSITKRSQRFFTRANSRAPEPHYNKEGRGIQIE